MTKNIKKIIGFLFCFVFCTVIAVGVPQMASAAEVAIDETNFPDEIFRDYVRSEFDKDNNEELSEEEITRVKGIKIDGIKELKGIEYFTALIQLECYGNQLTSLDVSHNTALQYLSCYSNQLTNLDLNGATALRHLFCSYNQLTDLDVSHNTALMQLDCSHNQLTSLDVSHNTALIKLECYSNQLTSLDVSHNIALTQLYCYSNQLTNLDLNESTALTQLHCYSNQLTSLDISHNAALTKLNCYSNQLTSLDISHNAALIQLHCYSNQLTSLNASYNMALQYLDCSNNQLTSLDLSYDTALVGLHCYNNQLANLDINKATDLTQLWCFNNQLTSLNLNEATALTSLSCNSNQLTSLDVSQNTALQYLSCYSNQLTNLDINKATDLTQLLCYNNQLIELKLNSQTYNKLSLYKFYLHGNVSLSDLQNATETKIDSSTSLIKVMDITKPATYKVDGKNFTIIYIDDVISPSPSTNPVVPSDAHIFNDYNYTSPMTDDAPVIYGNGISKTMDGKKVNNKALTVYTDIFASYKYTPNNNNDTVKASVGKVIVGVTKSNTKPDVNNKNKITDTSASKIAKAKTKNGQITVTSVGKEGGLVYLWVIDTGNKGVSACCPIDVKLAPKKLEVQNTYGTKVAKNTKLANGSTLDVCVAGLVGTAKTQDGTYTAEVASKYKDYVEVVPVEGSTNQFKVNAKGLKNSKDTKTTITFKCDQNGKKANLSLTIIK